MTHRHVDLSHVVTDAMTTYPGLPVPQISDHLTRAHAEEVYGPGYTFQIGMITMCSNTGTYLDVPFHRYADGYDLTGLELSRVADVDAVVVDCRGITAIGAAEIPDGDLRGRAVLFHTGHGVYFGTDRYFIQHPHLTADAAERLVDATVACVGIDSLNIDATSDGHRPVHSILLGAGIPIIEHLRGLEELPAEGCRFTAVPPMVEGMGTFTVRAFATLP